MEADIVPAGELPQQQVPMEFSAEEISETEKAHFFKATIMETKKSALLKFPNIRENWEIYFPARSQMPSIEFTVYIDYIPVTFKAKLFYQEQDEGDLWKGLVFKFKPKESPHPQLKSLKGKFTLEFLNCEKVPYYKIESSTWEWAYNDDLQTDELFYRSYYQLNLKEHIIMDDANLGEDESLIMRLTFVQLTPHLLQYPNRHVLENLCVKKADSDLNRDLESLLYNPEDTDVVIRTNDGVTFNAHKFILKMRMPMFRAMFATDMLETTNGIVETPEISAGAMKILLHYIYTGKLHPDWKNWKQYAGEVIRGAQQYQLDGLIQSYDRLLITLCTDFDAKDLLEVAKLHGLKQAEEDIGRWIRGIAA